jgi:hypothetical protein
MDLPHVFITTNTLVTTLASLFTFCNLSNAPQRRAKLGNPLYIWYTSTRKGKAAVKEAQESAGRATEAKELPQPQGIGMAVAFDWGLTVQLLLMPIIATVLGQSSPVKIPGHNPILSKVLPFIIAWPLACIPALLGEMIRRGRHWALRIQLVANVLLSLAGLFSLANLYRGMRTGNFWPLVTEVILVIISPLIVWRLSRPATADWFKTVTVAEACHRHGGSWVWFITLWATVGGVLQTIAAMMR